MEDILEGVNLLDEKELIKALKTQFSKQKKNDTRKN